MAESEVVKAIRKQREEIARNEIDTLKRMAKLWVPSYKYLKKQVDALTALIQQKRNKGEPVEIEYIHSLDRYKTMMAQAKKMIRDYNKAIAGQIRGTEAEMVDIGHRNAKQIINIAEPDDPLWTRVNKRETRIMAAMTADETPLDNLLAKSFGQMKEGMESALITGISTGQGSSWIADQLMKAAEIPEQRALLIARTEVNRTYRQSNWEQMRSSRAILGYRRMCYKDTACFACLMLDKEFYPVDAEPTDHPNGKCSFVPVTRHFDPGADPNWESGRDWFEHQDPDIQRKLMGPGRFDLWKQSGVDPRNMVYIKPNDIWGGSPTVRTLENLGYGYHGAIRKTTFNLTAEREPEAEKLSRKNQPTSVNWDYVRSPEYHAKFKGLTDDEAIDELIYNKAIDILEHRQNTLYEDMHLIDTNTREVVGSQTHSEPVIKKVPYNKSLNDAVRKYPGRLISIHNHPTSAPPSASDFGSYFSKNYKLGIVVAHDGTIYVYRNNLGAEFPFAQWDELTTSYSGVELERKLQDITERYRIIWKKL